MRRRNYTVVAVMITHTYTVIYTLIVVTMHTNVRAAQIEGFTQDLCYNNNCSSLHTDTHITSNPIH